MPYRRTVRFESPLVAWHEIELTEPAPQWSGAYSPESPRLMVPGSRWVEAEQRGERFVCDALSPLWLTPATPYRMRQPFAGQRSLVLVFGGAAAEAALGDEAGGRAAVPRRLRRPRLDPAAHWALARCRASLEAGEADRLQLEETVLALLPSLPSLPAAAGDEAPTAHRAVERARELLAADPGADRSLRELAMAAACSPFHLARCFRRATGLGLHAYRTQLRMALALQRLAEGEQALIQLALDLGYASHSHFSAVFRAFHGVPPSRAREVLGRSRRPRARPGVLRGALPVATAVATAGTTARTTACATPSATSGALPGALPGAPPAAPADRRTTVRTIPTAA